MPMSSKNPQKAPAALAEACACCGRLVVLLRRTDSPPGQTEFVACYIRGWDGNPYYVPGTHRKHPGPKYERFLRENEPPKDPFFSLD